MAPLSTSEPLCNCLKPNRSPSVPPLKKSFNTTKPSWKPLPTRKWILSWMTCGLSSRPRPMATQSPSLSCFSRLGWWKSKCKCWSLIRRAWMKSLTMSLIRMPQGLGHRQIWDSRSFMKIVLCYCRWWRPWLSNSMKWRCCMKTLRRRRVMSGPKSMNSRRFCQCKETCIWDHKVACNHSMETWIWWIQT